MNKPRKTVMSPLLLGVVVTTILLLIGCNLFFALYPYNRLSTEMLVVASLLSGGGALLLIVLGARRGFSVITISEEGISRCLFGKFCKLSMKWDEIYEISYFESGMAFLIFSQTKSIQGLSYWKITKIKNLIQIQLTQKNYDFIKQYIQQPIKGLTDKKLAKLKLK